MKLPPLYPKVYTCPPVHSSSDRHGLFWGAIGASFEHSVCESTQGASISSLKQNRSSFVELSHRGQAAI